MVCPPAVKGMGAWKAFSTAWNACPATSPISLLSAAKGRSQLEWTRALRGEGSSWDGRVGRLRNAGHGNEVKARGDTINVLNICRGRASN